MKRPQKFIAIERSAFRDRRYLSHDAILGGDLPTLVFPHREPDDTSRELDRIFQQLLETRDPVEQLRLANLHDDLANNPPPSSQRHEVPKNYYIFPVTSKPDEWGGVDLLEPVVEKIRADGGPIFCPTLTTMSLPQLHHHEDKDRVSLMVLTERDYNRCKTALGTDLIETKTLDELFKTYRRMLPEEPPSVKISDQLADMLSRVPAGPLAGIVVVAFDQQIAGSLASEELARAGATVIKIEKEKDGDPKRRNSTATAFNTFNAGKFSVAFSDSAEDQELKRELLAKADVIIDNRSGPAQDRDKALQGILQQKQREKPLVYCAISGFGRDTHIPAYDRVVQAASGMADINGRLIPFPLIDMATGKEAAHAITMNLLMRERMTPNQLENTPLMRLDVSMTGVALNIMANPIATMLDTGEAQSTIVPFNLYDTKDGRIAVAIATDDQYQRLCDLLGAAEINQYKTNVERQQHREEIEEVINKRLKTKSLATWMKIFTDGNISAQPVLSLKDAISQHGRDVIQPTSDGQLFVTSPVNSNLFPSTPHIGSAPQHNGDRASVAAFVQHLNEHPGPRAVRNALDVANRPDKEFQENYRFVDLHNLNFSGKQGNVDWANGKFFRIKKIGKVKAERAKLGDVIDMVHNDDFHQKSVTMEGDWKITTASGEIYHLSDAQFHHTYVASDGEEGAFVPRPQLRLRRAIEVTENIKFITPNGDTNYIPQGGYITMGSKGAYGIHPKNISGNYEVAQWSSREHARGDNSTRGDKPIDGR